MQNIKWCHSVWKHHNKRYFLSISLLEERRQQGHCGSVEAYKVIQKKSLKEWEWKFTPDKLANPIHFMVSWAPGTRLKEGRCKRAFLAELMLTVAYMAHKTAVLIIHNHCLSLWSTPKRFHFFYHCAMQRPLKYFIATQCSKEWFRNEFA